MSLVKRTNSGKQNGLLITAIGNWNLRQIEDHFYKVASITPINGKANYSFGVREGRIDTHAGRDCAKLKDERPDLFKAINEWFQPKPAETAEVADESDPYGDLAISRRRKLTPEQNWKRGLLQMRRIDFEHAAVQKASFWESGIRMLYAGVFKTKISDEQAEAALHWITQRQGGVDLTQLLQIEQDFYGGKYGANPSTKLAELLDILSGDTGFDNEEADYGQLEDDGLLQSGGIKEHEVCGRGADGRKDHGGMLQPEADPFADFQ